MAVVKRFQIEPLPTYSVEETIATPIVTKNKQGEEVVSRFEMTKQTREVEGGFMVYFPGGHSIRAESKEHLKAMGLVESANVEIDADTGLPVVPPVTRDIKRVVEGKTQARHVR